MPAHMGKSRPEFWPAPSPVLHTRFRPTAAASVRRDSWPDQRAARPACRNRVHMARNPPRSAKSNAGDRKGVSENASRDALNGRIGLFGRAIRPGRSTTLGPETEIVWKIAFGCFSVTEGTPNGECRVIIRRRADRPAKTPALPGDQRVAASIRLIASITRFVASANR
jgi:hypothetical protein